MGIIIDLLWDAFKARFKLNLKHAFDWNPLFPC